MARYLFISDMHVSEDTYDIHLKNLKRVIKCKNIDYVISAGDNGEIDRRFIHSLGVPFYTIYGNHDPFTPDDILLTDGIHKIGTLRILAFNGILAIHPRKPYHRALTDPIDLVNKLSKSTKVDIVLTHDVPERATVDVGHKVPAWHGVIDYIDQILEPKYHIYGHYHSSFRIVMEDVIFNTRGIRVDSSWATHGIVIDSNKPNEYEIVYGDALEE